MSGPTLSYALKTYFHVSQYQVNALFEAVGSIVSFFDVYEASGIAWASALRTPWTS